MSGMGPIGLMVIGFFLLMFGFGVPFLMIIGILEPGFVLVFLSYMASIGGLIMGVIASALYIRERQD
jgi:membrane associated rhomboid family serine protease